MNILYKILSILFVFNTLNLFPAGKTDFPFINDAFVYKNISFGTNLLVNVGTHVNMCGISFFVYSEEFIKYDRSEIMAISFLSRFSLKNYKNNIGIPESSASYEFYNQMTLSIGKKSYFPGKPYLIHYPMTFNLFYGSILYFSSDNTTQISGSAGIVLSFDNFQISLRHDNDVFAMLKQDQYRTAALELSAFFNIRGILIGSAIGFKLWTGTRSGLPKLPRGLDYDLSGQYGGKYTNGILYLSFIINEIKISIGYDSEAIRNAIQNSYHYIINTGNIPMLDREDRFYFQISLNDFINLY